MGKGGWGGGVGCCEEGGRKEMDGSGEEGVFWIRVDIFDWGGGGEFNEDGGCGFGGFVEMWEMVYNGGGLWCFGWVVFEFLSCE